MPSPASCQIAGLFLRDPVTLIILGSQFFVSFATGILLLKIVRNEEMHRHWSIFNFDLKIVLCTGFVYYCIGTLNAILITAYKFGLLLFTSDPCDLVWPGLICWMTQVSFCAICVISYALFHGCILIERSYASFFQKRPLCDGFLGILLGLVIICVSPVPQRSIIRWEMVAQERPYCSSLYENIELKAMLNSTVIILVDYAITAGDFLLYIYNKRQVKAQKRHPNGYDLKRSFKLREINLSIRLIFPLSIVHSLTFSVQMLIFIFFARPALGFSYVGVSHFYETINFSRLFANFILLSFLNWFIGRNRAERTRAVPWVRQRTQTEIDIHFEQFNQIIA